MTNYKQLEDDLKELLHGQKKNVKKSKIMPEKKIRNISMRETFRRAPMTTRSKPSHTKSRYLFNI